VFLITPSSVIWPQGEQEQGQYQRDGRKAGELADSRLAARPVTGCEVSAARPVLAVRTVAVHDTLARGMALQKA